MSFSLLNSFSCFKIDGKYSNYIISCILLPNFHRMILNNRLLSRNLNLMSFCYSFRKNRYHKMKMNCFCCSCLKNRCHKMKTKSFCCNLLKNHCHNMKKNCSYSCLKSRCHKTNCSCSCFLKNCFSYNCLILSSNLKMWQVCDSLKSYCFSDNCRYCGKQIRYFYSFRNFDCFYRYYWNSGQNLHFFLQQYCRNYCSWNRLSMSVHFLNFPIS